MKLASILFLTLATLSPAVGLRVATFNIGAHLVVPPDGGPAYFDYGLGDPGTPDHDSVLAVLDRIDADVVSLQEIHAADVAGINDDVDLLAATLGYPHVFVSPTTNTFDTSLRVIFLSRYPFISTAAIGSPPGTKEITRLFPAVKVDVPSTARDPLIIAAHLKSGTSSEDRFRRAVEMRRLTNYLATQGLTSGDNYILMGDFNLSSTNRTFTTLPSGLPSTYDLGADILLPITYSTNPLSYFNNPSVTRLDPRQLNNSASTFQSGSVIDLFLVSPAIAGRPLSMEIYNSVLDTSNTAGLPKSGSPLAAGTSAAASDHYALFADFELDAAGLYVYTTPGQTISEGFTGFGGNHDPASWVTTGGAWRGVDDGSSGISGLRSYGPIGDSSLGILADPGSIAATAGFINLSESVLTALQISFAAEQWRAAFGGRADTLAVDLVVNAVPTPLPALAYSANVSSPTGAVLGGTSTPRTAVVTGLTIAPGASFELRFKAVPGPGGGVPPNDVFLNEFHYDNAGTDTNEFIEIVVGPGYSGLLSSINVVLYNGEIATTGVTYNTLNLATAFTLEGTYNGYRFFTLTLPSNGLQNGLRDGFAIVNTVTSQVLHFLSYDGVFTAGSGPAAGLTSTSVGIAENSSTLLNSSLGLTGSGGTSANFTWAISSGSNTKGAPNSGQNFVNPILPPQGIAIDDVSITFLVDTDGDGLPDVTDLDDDNDEFSDVDESVFGTDPLEASSRYSMSLTFPSPSPGMVRLAFPTSLGRSYAVESSLNLSNWSAVGSYPGTGNLREVDVAVNPVDPQKFYRIRATLP